MKDRTKRGVWLLLAPLFLATAFAPGCTRTQAQVSPDTPPLDVPLPPSRVIATNIAPTPPGLGAPSAAEPSGVEELNRSGDPPRPPASVPPRQAARPADTSKPETSVDPPKPPEESRVATSPLQTTPPQKEGEIDAAIRADMKTAATNLSKIDYQRLNPDAKLQYDIANGNLRRAEEELKAKNFPAAKSLVEKAVAIASQLSSR